MFYRPLCSGWASISHHHWVDKSHFKVNQKICSLSKGGCDSALVPLCPQQWCKMRTPTKVSLYKGEAWATELLPPTPFQPGKTPGATGVPKAFLASTLSLRLRPSGWLGPHRPLPLLGEKLLFRANPPPGIF